MVECVRDVNIENLCRQYESNQNSLIGVIVLASHSNLSMIVSQRTCICNKKVIGTVCQNWLSLQCSQRFQGHLDVKVKQVTPRSCLNHPQFGTCVYNMKVIRADCQNVSDVQTTWPRFKGYQWHSQTYPRLRSRVNVYVMRKQSNQFMNNCHTYKSVTLT